MLYVAGLKKSAERVDVSELFARRIAKRGFHITWIINDPEQKGIWINTRWHNQHAYIIGSTRFGGPIGSVLAKIYELVGDLLIFVTAIQKRPDIIQVKDRFFSGVLGLLAAKIIGSRYTFWLSYPFPESRLMDFRDGHGRFPVYSYFVGHMSSFLLYRIILRFADHAFVQSELMKKNIIAHGIPGEKMTSIPMGVSEELIRMGESEKPKVIPGLVVYLGTLARIRRLDTLIRAMRIVVNNVPYARLVLVGGGVTPDDLVFLKQEVEKLEMDGAVEFVGYQPFYEACNIVKSAQVCVSPIYPNEILNVGSPTKLVEYLALGKAVVANDHPEQSQILKESGAGLCVPWSARAFGKAISELLINQECTESMAKLGPPWVRDNRLYGHIEDIVRKKYQQILSDR